MAGAWAAIVVAEATIGATLGSRAFAMLTAVAMSAAVAADHARASRVERASRVDADCAARTTGNTSRVMVTAGTTRNVRFIGGESSGTARETGGNGRTNTGEHLPTSDRAINHGAILRRGIGVE